MLQGSEGLRGGVLWDPAPIKTWSSLLREVCEHDTVRDEYILRERLGLILSSKLLSEMDTADVDAAARFEAPLLVVSAPRDARLLNAGRGFASQAPNGTHRVIDGADHSFTTDDAEAELQRVTLDWLKKQLA